MIDDLVRKNRSYRRFHEDFRIERSTLVELVDLARLSGSGGNLQPLKYAICCEPEINAQVFETLVWAAYLEDWDGPEPGQRPSGYILVLGDTGIREQFGCDHGIAAQSIVLGAADKGLGACMIATVDAEVLYRVLEIDERYTILLAIAFGKPNETIVIDELGADGDIRYWRDEEGVHHVPKRSLASIIVGRGA